MEPISAESLAWISLIRQRFLGLRRTPKASLSPWRGIGHSLAAIVIHHKIRSSCAEHEWKSNHIAATNHLSGPVFS
jgi:hypothetical protein